MLDCDWEFRRVLFRSRATILSAILFGLYYANYVEGWITAEQVAALTKQG
jgi:hypothetical protein